MLFLSAAVDIRFQATSPVSLFELALIALREMWFFYQGFIAICNNMFCMSLWCLQWIPSIVTYCTLCSLITVLYMYGNVIFVVHPSTDIKLEDVPLHEMTERWQRGEISNYDYLLYLNKYVNMFLFMVVLFDRDTVQ